MNLRGIVVPTSIAKYTEHARTTVRVFGATTAFATSTSLVTHRAQKLSAPAEPPKPKGTRSIQRGQLGSSCRWQKSSNGWLQFELDINDAIHRAAPVHLITFHIEYPMHVGKTAYEYMNPRINWTRIDNEVMKGHNFRFTFAPDTPVAKIILHGLMAKATSGAIDVPCLSEPEMDWDFRVLIVEISVGRRRRSGRSGISRRGRGWPLVAMI